MCTNTCTYSDYAPTEHTRIFIYLGMNPLFAWPDEGKHLQSLCGAAPLTWAAGAILGLVDCLQFGKQ